MLPTRAVWLLHVLFVLVLTCRAEGREAAPKVGPPQSMPDGTVVHTVESPYQDGPTKVRVLTPRRMEPGKRFRVVYVLPVEAGDGARYGDGLAEIRKHGLHDRFGLVCIAPTFARLPWYADHPTNRGIRQESHLLKLVVPFIDKTYPVRADAKGRLLLGFSKSGWGAFTLLLRHPEVFGKAAAWDAPLDMSRPGPYGSGENFGTAVNFANYQVVKLLENRSFLLGKEPRLAMLGYGSFRKAHVAVHELMDRWKIPHLYRDGPKRKHDWHSGWVEEAMAFLAGSEKR